MNEEPLDLTVPSMPKAVCGSGNESNRTSSGKYYVLAPLMLLI